MFILLHIANISFIRLCELIETFNWKLIIKKQAQDLESRACNFTAIINTNHQRKIFHSKAETFLLYRRSLLRNVTFDFIFNLLL